MYLTGQRKKYISFLIVGIMVFVTLAGAVFSAPVCVYALSLGGLRGTIASLIISLLLQTGVAPTNQNFINAINNAYGAESSIGTIENMINNGLLTESGGSLIDTGLSQAIQNESVWSDYGLNEIFETTINDAGVMSGSGAVNLANQAINLGTGGTIGAFAGAAVIGVGVGVLANHVREYVSNLVKYGFPMSFKAKQNLLNNIPSGYGKAFYLVRTFGGREYTHIQYVPSGTQCSGYITNANGSINTKYYDNNGIASVSRYSVTYINNTQNGNASEAVSSAGVSYSGATGNVLIDTNVNPIFSSQDNINNYISDYSNNSNQGSGATFSPDLIGNNGNLTYNNDIDEPNNIGNIIPDGHDMTPVDMSDYQNYIDQANDNTDNNDIGEETQGQDFSDFVNPYIQEIPQEPIVPDDPVGPDQPDMPVKPTPSPEDIETTLTLTPDENLKDKFPFCIPFDIYDLFSGLAAEREAPVITCPVDVSGNTVTVDLSEYESVAELLRLLELILFIIGLAVATRYLIGATGGG